MRFVTGDAEPNHRRSSAGTIGTVDRLDLVVRRDLFRDTEFSSARNLRFPAAWLVQHSAVQVAAEVAPKGVTVELADISDLPLYNADIERERGLPEAVQRLRIQISEADGALFATPEYNYSITGAMKNAIDWASRRPSPLDDQPAAITGTGGRSGTARAQRHLRDILKHNHVQVVSRPEVALPGPWSLFTDGL